MSSPRFPSLADLAREATLLASGVNHTSEANPTKVQFSDTLLETPLTKPITITSVHSPSQTAVVRLVSEEPVKAENIAPERQGAIPITTSGKDVVVPVRHQLHDSACILTPVSFQPRSAKPLAPSLSPVHHTQLPHTPDSLRVPSPAIDDPAITDKILQPSSLRSVTVPINDGSTITSEGVTVAQPTPNLTSNLHQAPKVDQSPACEFREDYKTRSARLLNEVLSTKPFAYPPKDMVQENLDYQKALELTDREICKGFKVQFVENNIDEHLEYWKPFDKWIYSERSVLNSLKQTALEKKALREQIEQQIIRLRMGVKLRKRFRLSIRGAKQAFDVFINTQAKLDREIAEIHSEWESRLVNFKKTTEEAFWSDSHRPEFDRAAVSHRRRCEEAKEEHKRLMVKIGWDKLPYLGQSEATTPIQNDISVPVWFKVLEAKGATGLHAKKSELERYKEYIGLMVQLKQQMDEDAKNNTSSRPRPQQQARKQPKQWHNPSSGWPYQNWRERGGWWVCRTGPETTLAEQSCPLCNTPQRHRAAKSSTQPKEKTAAERYNELMSEVDKAMALTGMNATAAFNI